MLSPCFILESVFYTQSVMRSPRFIPESVFCTQSVVRSPCFILAPVAAYFNSGFSYNAILCFLEKYHDMLVARLNPVLNAA